VRKIALLSIVAIMLTGCTELPETINTPEPMKPVGSPDIRRSYDLYLLPTGNADSSKVRVGEQTADVKQLFPVPSSNATEFRELPSGFQSPYSAYGFNQEAGTSFGTISYDNNIALAMTTEKGLPDSDVLSTEAMYETAFGRTPETIPAKVQSPSLGKESSPKARYWFWDDKSGSQRFMICAVASKDKNKSGLFDLTCVVGDDVVMAALRMDDQDAFQDRRFLDSNGLYGGNTVDKEGNRTPRNIGPRTEQALKGAPPAPKPNPTSEQAKTKPLASPLTVAPANTSEPQTANTPPASPAPGEPVTIPDTTGVPAPNPTPTTGGATTSGIH
jgi:hypothetical protein